MPPPLILTATCIRIERLEHAPKIVPIKIKICGHKDVDILTTMINPFYDNVDLEGDGFGKTVKRVGKAIKKSAPLIDKASDLAMIAGTVTGQPELVALGTAGKAVATLTGGEKKRPIKPMKALRYSVTKSPLID